MVKWGLPLNSSTVINIYLQVRFYILWLARWRLVESLSNTKLCCPLIREIAILLIPNQDLLNLDPTKYHSTKLYLTTDSCWDYYLHCVTQVALASLECVQPVVKLVHGQSASLVSFPIQPTLFKEIGPVPGPNAAPDCAVASANKIVWSYKLWNWI